MEIESQIDWQEVERLIPSQIKDIRSVLEDKYSITVPNNCDEFIGRCLRVKDGNLDKAIKLIKAFHSATMDVKAWDATILPSLYQDFYNVGTVTPLLQRDQYGRRVFIIRTEMWDPLVMNFDQAIAGIWMIAQYVNSEFTDIQRHGLVSIWDFSHFSLQQAWAIKQWRVITIMKWIQNCVNGRTKAFHAIFHPKIVGVLYGGVKPFLKEKLRKRIVFHGDNLESLHKYVHPNCLPTYLGGDLDLFGDACIDKALIKELLQKDDYFTNMLANRLPLK